MEGNSRKDEVGNEKTTYKAGIERHNAECDEARANPSYTKAREGWKKFIRGELTNQQLEEYLGVNKDSRTEEIKDMFNAEEVNE